MLWKARLIISRFELGKCRFPNLIAYISYGDDYMIPIKIETLLEGRKVE